MAIAGLLIMTEAAQRQDVRARLAAAPHVAETRDTEDPFRLAAVLEAPADQVEGAMAAMSTWEGVLAVDLAFLSYEDDLEDKGYIPCAPHKPGVHREPGRS